MNMDTYTGEYWTHCELFCSRERQWCTPDPEHGYICSECRERLEAEELEVEHG